MSAQSFTSQNLSKDRAQIDMSGGSKEVTELVRKQKCMLDLISKTEWLHKEPQDYLVEFVAKYGSLPSLFAPQRGGFAAYEGYVLRSTPFERIEIRDEKTVNRFAVDSYDFVYAYVRFHVLSQCFSEVLNLGPSIMYDAGKKLLCARGKDIETCAAILAIATEVGNCKRTAVQVEKDDEMAKAVLASKEKHGHFLKLLTENLRQQPGLPIVETSL
jgi:hypothetical protein